MRAAAGADTRLSMRIAALASVSVLPFFLVSCGAGRWTEAQKAELSSIAVPGASIAADAYLEPVGNEQHSAPIIATGTGSFATGAAVNAGAQLILEIAAAAQQEMFEDRYADAIAKAPGTIPGNLSERIRRAVSKSIGSHSFFKGKIGDSSPNRFVVTVEHYRYVRAGKEDEVLVTPALFGKFELKGSNGTKLLSRKFTAAGSTKRPISAFANDKALASRAFDEAIAQIGVQAYNAVGAKLGETALAEGSAMPAPGSDQPVQLEGVSGLAASCSYPYKLTRHCNIWSGAGLHVTVRGQKLKIAGSADGRIVLVRNAALVPKNSVTSTGSMQYEAVRNALKDAGVKILRQRDLLMPGKAGGFFLELDRDGFSVLAGPNR